MSRLKGGVYIVNPDGLRGDIVSAEGNENKLVVRLRGSNGAEIPVDDCELVEYTEDYPSEQPSTQGEEHFRYYLYQKAQTCDDFYLHERVLTIELGDEFTYLVVSNSAGENPLPHEIEGQALVRLVEAYFIGQGSVVGANGRHLTSFHKALRPFWKEESDGFSKLSGETSGEILEQLQTIFSSEGANSGLIFFRAFCYAHHRLDYHKQEENESLLDVYCVTFYVIKLLQGQIKDMNMESASLIEEELAKYKSQDVHMSVEDLLWCFCILHLRIGSDVRRYKGLSVYNHIFPDPFDLTMNEELVICQLAMELRSDSPVSFLSAYRMVMDTKGIVPQPLRFEWMKFAYEYAVRGLNASDRWGDPFFQYTFHSIVAYWLPTTTHAPSPYSLDGIDSRLKIANEFKREGKEYVPGYMLWMGQQHEFSVQNVLNPFRTTDKDTELTVPLIDSFTYKPVGMNGTSGGPENSACARCSKPVQRRLQCSRCGKVHYCSKSCQVAHWKGSHNKVCTPKISLSEECGNCSKTVQKMLKCSKCGQVNYCNRKCQLEHWKGGHKQYCREIVAVKVAS
jgi:hypothetical protein